MRTFRHLGDPHGGNDPAEAIDAAWATATGPRPDNQDLADATPRWAVVSDGAGGLPGGATAARLAVGAAVARLDALVLASDGIEALPEAAIMEVVDGAPDAQQAARRLVDAALAAGATDNVTVAVVRHRRGAGTA
jgi:serine/threonine protein phosphatase PrpC